MTPRILIVDDDRKIVRVLKSYIEQAGMRTYVAYDGIETMRIVRSERPDLIILDLMLPGRDGWEITRQIRADEHLFNICILMLTARVEDSDKLVGLELGADDYLTKPFNPLEVVARTKAILRRSTGTLMPAHVIEADSLRLDIDNHMVSLNGQAVDLTRTEFALLQTLMENPNHIFTRSDLIQRALGYTYEGMERTIDSHIKNLRKKIESDPANPRYVETVFGIGYCFREKGKN